MGFPLVDRVVGIEHCADGRMIDFIHQRHRLFERLHDIALRLGKSFDQYGDAALARMVSNAL